MRILASATVVALVGCGGGHTDIKGTMKFADRSDAEIARLVSASGGTDMFTAESQVNQFADPITPDPCPAIAISGQTVTVTGGCTTKDNVEIQGTAKATNPVGWSQIDPQYGVDTVYELHQFVLIQSGFTQSYDGSMTITDSYATYDADITSTQLGVSVRSDIYYHCDQGSLSCDLSGSGIELVGVGGALVDGTVHVGNAASADFTLHGVDTLTAHITQGCVSWQISGTQRAKTCP